MGNFSGIFTVKLSNVNGEPIEPLMYWERNNHYLSQLDFLTTPANLQAIALAGGLRVNFDLISEKPVAILSKEYSRNPELQRILPCYSADPLVSAVKLSAEERANFLKEKIDEGIFFNVDIETLGRVVDSLSDFVQYIGGAISPRINILKNLYMNNPPLKRAIEALMAEKSTYSGRNLGQALVQRTEFDEFFLNFPSFSQLRSDIISPYDLFPHFSKIYTPFTSPVYNGPWWKSLERKSITDQRAILNDLRKRKVVSMKESEVYDFVPMPLDEVLGSVDNLMLPLLENEQNFYDSFIQFIKEDLAYSNDEAAAEELFKAGGLTNDMRDYYEALLEATMYHNWACTGMLRINPPEQLSPDDMEGENIDKYNDENLEFQYHASNVATIDGFEYIKGFIRKAATIGLDNRGPLGSGVYAEAIIKLNRWGKRRPVALKFDNSDITFSLEKFCQDVPVMDFSKLTVVRVNGYELELLGGVTSGVRLRDDTYLSSLGLNPKLDDLIGFSTVRRFENGAMQQVYVSCMDVVTAYRSGIKLIHGITMDSERRFIVDMEVTDSTTVPLADAINSTIDSHVQVCYVPNPLKEVATEYRTNARNATDFFVLSKCCTTDSFISSVIERCTLMNLALFNSKSLELQLSLERYFQVNIARSIVPVYATVSSLIRHHLNPLNYSKILNFYADVMDKLNIESSVSFFRPKAAIESSVKPLQAFTGAIKESNSTKELESVKESNSTKELGGVNMSMLVCSSGDISKISSLNPLISTNSTGELTVFGYMGQINVKTPEHRIVLFSVKDSLPVTPKTGGYNEKFVMKWVSVALLSVLTQPNSNKFRFASDQTLSNIISAMPK